MSNLSDLFGPPVAEYSEEDYQEKVAKISPFDFANTINYSKNNLIVDEWSENQYSPYIVNRALGFAPDTVIAANEMNARPHLDKKMQYDFLLAVVRKGKRYNKWIKGELEDIEVVQEYFKYNFEKAKAALKILSKEDIDNIKSYLKTSKGGKL